MLKEKLESTVKELASEKEKKKVQPNIKVEDTKNVDLQTGRRKKSVNFALITVRLNIFNFLILLQ